MPARDNESVAMDAPCVLGLASESHGARREHACTEGKEDRKGIDGAFPSSSSRPPLLRALFVTLEFSSHNFSGNGTLAQACVRGLAASRGVESVVVVSSRPADDDDEEEEEATMKKEKSGDKTFSISCTSTPAPSSASTSHRLHGASALVEVPVPRSLWGRLDARSPWREFRDGAAEALSSLPLVSSSSSQQPKAAATGFAEGTSVPSPSSSSSVSLLSSFDVILAVDWTGVAAAEELLRKAEAEKSEKRGAPPLPRVVYLNFRVFSRSAETPQERQLVRRAEGRAIALSAASAALCELDAQDLELLAEEIEREGEGKKARREGRRREIAVVLPPLRREFAEMAPPNQQAEIESGKENEDGNSSSRSERQQQQRRDLLLCCVRLSAEKEPHRFVEVVEFLARSGVLSELGIIPALVGGGDSGYARDLRERMRGLEMEREGEEAEAEAEEENEKKGSKKKNDFLVEGGFLGASELASRFFDRTLLNFHPCLADAYGMSAVEAGSRGAPSVIHRGGSESGSGREGREEEVEGGSIKEVESEGKSKISVGASAILRAGEGESIALDLSLPAEEVAARVAELLREAVAGGEGGGRERERGGAAAATKAKTEAKANSASFSLREVGERAQRRARSWGEREHGEALAALARGVVG